MGEVFKVLHIHLNAIRVIKLMRATIASEEGAHERFLREARLATRIHHPNVATLFDFSTLDDGSRYMVWEYIEGTNLHELLEERGPLSPKYAATLAIQALRGLDAIHRAGIVHRDVSPENLMITRDDEGTEQVKIIDLGIAKQWGDDGDNKTKTGMFVGKWKYCSPEHLGMLEAGQRIDGRADLYSFGIVLYEMLTGIPPFQADTPHGYLMLHASEKPRPLHDVNPSVPYSPDLESVIFQALEKDRNRRFKSGRDFAEALEKLVPTLSDSPGAQSYPMAMEVTDEATRVVAKPGDQQTVVTDSGAAATVQTSSSAVTVDTDSGLKKTLLAEPAIGAEPLPESRKRPVGAIAAAIAAVLLIVTGVVFLAKRHATTTPSPAARVEASAVPRASAHLAINAFPWANVTSIRNTETGEQIELKEALVTPSAIDLPPGKYELTLSNPAFPKPMVKTVTLQSGDGMVNVEFIDASRASLPDFEATR
ncbi:MAG TPA: serine/threonine-protein kinase, partial [Thermoanaerobaculia bacterium]|nr:serine/threonine-protein kinase [Thermoanaerobaculia bacterium]